MKLDIDTTLVFQVAGEHFGGPESDRNGLSESEKQEFWTTYRSLLLANRHADLYSRRHALLHLENVLHGEMERLGGTTPLSVSRMKAKPADQISDEERRGAEMDLVELQDLKAELRIMKSRAFSERMVIEEIVFYSAAGFSLPLSSPTWKHFPDSKLRDWVESLTPIQRELIQAAESLLSVAESRLNETLRSGSKAADRNVNRKIAAEWLKRSGLGSNGRQPTAGNVGIALIRLTSSEATNGQTIYEWIKMKPYPDGTPVRPDRESDPQWAKEKAALRLLTDLGRAVAAARMGGLQMKI